MGVLRKDRHDVCVAAELFLKGTRRQFEQRPEHRSPQSTAHGVCLQTTMSVVPTTQLRKSRHCPVPPLFLLAPPYLTHLSQLVFAVFIMNNHDKAGTVVQRPIDGPCPPTMEPT